MFKADDLVPNEIYHIMWQDEEVATVLLSQDKKKIHFQRYVYGIKQPFNGDILTVERFYRFLKDRCYEDGRGDLQEILEMAGLSSNNPYEWVKISHGVTWEDFWWVKFEGEEITWDDVRVR